MKILLTVLLLASLAACSSIPNEVTTVVEPAPRPDIVLPNVDKLTTRPVEWIVITPDNVDEVFATLEEQGTDVVLFGLTDDGYENLSVNTANIIKLLEQKNAIIMAYKKYNETTQ